jgi:hypothetical protein
LIANIELSTILPCGGCPLTNRRRTPDLNSSMWSLEERHGKNTHPAGWPVRFAEIIASRQHRFLSRRYMCCTDRGILARADVKFMAGRFASSRSEVAIAMAVSLLSASACSSPTSACIDKEGRGNNAPMAITLTCTPVGSNAQCTAQPWYGFYAYCPEPLPPLVWTSSNSSVATVAPNGYVTVLARGEVDITVAAMTGYLAPQTWSALVDPRQPPQLLYFLSGIIRENDGSDTRIPGATVEILDGYNAGRGSAPSNQFGAYRIDRLLINVMFTVRASKAGYVPSTTTYVLGGPNSVTGSPFLDFRLSRATE